MTQDSLCVCVCVCVFMYRTFILCGKILVRNNLSDPHDQNMILVRALSRILQGIE